MHTVALGVKREVYGWGRSDNGAIGSQKTLQVNQSSPKTITLNLDHSDRVD